MEEESQTEVQLHLLLCFGPYYDVEGMIRKQQHILHTHTHTITPAVMDVPMQTCLKHKIDEFSFYGQNGMYCTDKLHWEEIISWHSWKAEFPRIRICLISQESGSVLACQIGKTKFKKRAKWYKSLKHGTAWTVGSKIQTKNWITLTFQTWSCCVIV